MDAADRSQDLEERMREAGIRSVLDAADAAPRASGPSGLRLCRLCRGRIPARRLAALPGAKTCVRCQRRLEEGRP